MAVEIYRVPLEFKARLTPGAGVLFRERLLFNGRLKKISIRFFLNVAERLEGRPFLERRQEQTGLPGSQENLIHMAGLPPAERVITGDDEMRVYEVDIPLKKYEWLGHTMVNRSPTATYTYAIIYEVEFVRN